MSKATVALYEDVPEFLVADIDGRVVGCGALHVMWEDLAEVRTIAVGAQWVTSDKADANTVYEITKALFGDAAQKQLAAGHAKGKLITKENAVRGAGIPFHAGAEKFYKEAGLLK